MMGNWFNSDSDSGYHSFHSGCNTKGKLFFNQNFVCGFNNVQL